MVYCLSVQSILVGFWEIPEKRSGLISWTRKFWKEHDCSKNGVTSSKTIPDSNDLFSRQKRVKFNSYVMKLLLCLTELNVVQGSIYFQHLTGEL